MRRLFKYNKSATNSIEITYNGEKVKFSLPDEVNINAETLNGELKSQPSKYGFLLLVHKGLITNFERAKSERKATFGRLFIKAKNQKINGRPMSDDLAKYSVEASPRYKRATEDCIKAKHDADVIFSCVRAFEERGRLMQTLASNERSYNKS